MNEKPGPQGHNAGITPGLKRPPTLEERVAALEAGLAELRAIIKPLRRPAAKPRGRR